MYGYILRLIQELPPDMIGTSTSPAASHLFQVQEPEDADLLDSDMADDFHHFTAKLLFLAKRTRPDIQTAVAYLCTRVKGPDTDNWKKLAIVIMYLQDTPGLPLVISVENSGNIRWYIDASYAIHNDMKSHTGVLMTIGKGTIFRKSCKQKLIGKSSKEVDFFVC